MTVLLSLLIILNTLAAFTIVFRDVRDVSSTWAWLLVLVGLPGIGLILYLFIGKKISKDNIFDLKMQQRLGLTPKNKLDCDIFVADKKTSERELIRLFWNAEDALYTEHNHMSLIYDGQHKFESLLRDISEAKHHIHLQYYIFNNDVIGHRIMNAIKDKAKQGVEVLVLYDAWGSHTLQPSFFSKLTKAGGKAVPFFGSSIPFVNLRMNYRNHRKIVVIDGEIGYIGGFNIGDEYLGQSKLGYWRDTHLRITGEAVHSLQTRFFVDWNAVVKKADQKSYELAYFPKLKSDNFNQSGIPMQIVSSGPDTDWEHIKLGFVKMISLAKKSIYIQTPYFIPDESVLDALKIAILSGIEVHIMIPNKPDHAFVYRATEYYAKLCQKLGAHIYLYEKGFLHAKTLVIDGRISTVGTSNFDIRSFRLNFELNAFIYDVSVSTQLEEQFLKDMTYSQKVTEEYFDHQSLWRKFKQSFARLLSPIL